MKKRSYLLALLFVLATVGAHAYEGEGEISEDELLAAEGITDPSPEYASREPAPSEIEKQEAASEPAPEETEWNFPDAETESEY